MTAEPSKNKSQWGFGARAYVAVAGILGERRFLFGDEPYSADATLGAFLMTARCTVFDSAFRGLAEEHADLVAYEERTRARFFPQMVAVRPAA